MIAKELETFAGTDKRLTAGHAAEAQLAFYLQRTFIDAPEIHVFNSLRFEADGDAAQIDHLILHPNGLIVIESKSVHAKVKINDRGEWLRLYQDRYQGMPSAKLQAERQVLFLRRYLASHAGQWLDASQRQPGSLADLPIDTLVAVSDGAVIDRPKNETHDYLVKAEAIPERINSLVRAHGSSKGFLGFFKSGIRLSPKEMARVASFLVDHHRPLRQSTPRTATPVTATEPGSQQPSPVAKSGAQPCKHCLGDRLEIRSGRYGYYFKCLDCQKNTAISRSCGTCGNERRTRKQGQTFSSECATCHHSETFFVNP